MTRLFFIMVLSGLLILPGCKKDEPSKQDKYANNPQHISVLTQHNDNTRAGLNDKEALLTTSNVNGKEFGKLFTLPVDDQIYAQPLVVGSLAIGGGTHNVVVVATVSNTVYVFDGDNGKLYWSNNYTVAGMRTPQAGDMQSSWCTPYTNITNNIGIVGTPVIDGSSNTIYFVARSTNGSEFKQHLHRVDLTSGAERSGSPVEIAATVSGTGDGNVSGTIAFDPRRGNQRQGLALVNGNVYISYASHCDWNPYHGWILGYDAQSLQQKIVYNDTANGEEGGIWQSGMGIAADAQGNLYVTTGNGTVGTPSPYTSNGPSGNGTLEIQPSPDPTDLTGRAESAMKLTPSGNTLTVTSYFTPFNYVYLNENDLDYGVMGTFLIPNSDYYFTGGKDGNLYILNKDNMGGWSSSGNNIQQTLSTNNNLHAQPAYYLGSKNEFAYVWSENDKLRALPFNRTDFTFSGNQVTSDIAGPTGQSGAVLSVSSNGTSDGTGILWASYAASGDAENVTAPGVLRAFDANDITKELWNSKISSEDDAGHFAKFCPPTIANGHVYLATFSAMVIVYGLK